MTDTNIFDMADSWNNAAVAFTAVKMNVTDLASAAGSLLMDLQVGGGSKFSVSKAGSLVSLGSITLSGVLGWSDVPLFRDAANTLAQRNGANAQTFRVYNTYTDASNYERGVLQWNSNALEVGTEQAGTGQPRVLRLKSSGGGSIAFSTNGNDRWTVSTGGGILANVDNSYDIGASGANRPRDLYLAGKIVTGNSASFGSTTGVRATAISSAGLLIGASTTGISQINLPTGVAPSAPNDGDIWREDNTNTGLKIRVNGVTKTVSLV